MSQVRHIEIIEAETDSDGNFLQTIDEEVEEIMFADEDEYEFITEESIDSEQPGKFDFIISEFKRFSNV